MRSLPFFFAGLLLASLPLTAAETLYRWVDADGNVYFSDRPPETQEAEQIEVDAELSDRRRIAGREQLKESERALNQNRIDRALSAQELAALEVEREKARQQRQIRCEDARYNLEVLSTVGPVFSRNAAGERVYVEDEQRDQQIAEYEQKVSEYCE
ncbi:MAG: DUF4124 domain-containing protein [Pseudomonadota bacterium]